METKIKAELLSFLFYNNAYLLEKLKNEEESYFIYQKGMQFSSSILGDFNMLSNKFRPKLSTKLTKNIPLETKFEEDSSLFDIKSLTSPLGKMGFVKKMVNNNNFKDFKVKNFNLIPLKFY